MSTSLRTDLYELDSVVLDTRDIVLGVATGYSAAQISPFVRSLRRSGFTDALVLLVDDVTLRAVGDLPEFADVHLLRVHPWRTNTRPIFRGRIGWRVLWPPIGAAEWLVVRQAARLGATRQQRIAGRVLHPQLGRFVFYRRLLRSVRFERMLIADVRDVVFQREPFRALAGPGLLCGLETDQYTVGSEMWNALWVRAGAGPAMLERIGHERVACAGVVHGDQATITRYVDRMVSGILEWPPRGLIVNGDQGLHNVLLRTGQLGPTRLFEPTSGPLATLNRMRLADLTVDERGRLLDDEGTVVAIVHQYDRVDGLADKLVAAAA